MNVPTLRFPEFSGEWEIRILSDISNKITDGTHDTPMPIEFGIPYLTAIHIKDGNIDYENCYYLSREDHEKIYRRCNPEYEDLLIVNIGAGAATCALNTIDYEFSLKNVALIKPNKKLINPYYLEQYQRKSSIQLFTRLSSGGAQPFLSLKEIGKFKIPYPPLPEQQKIASFLSAIDEKIRGLKRKKSLLEQYKKGVMQQLFSQEIRFKDEKGNDYPDWEEKKLGEVASNVMYGLNAASKEFDGENKYIRITDIDDNSRTFINDGVTSPDCELDDKYLLKEGDLLFARTGASVGKTYLYNYKDGKVYFAGFLIRFSLKDNIPYFIFQQTLQPSYNNWVTKMSMRSGQPGINAEEYKSFPIILPCIEEQTKIANFLSAIDEKIEIEDARIKQAEVWKKGLLQQLFV
ncbi:hypothetical protein BWI93_23785 [Siphonobacter sp. BAB-5385]|nr:hypothetical protein BWI93_23785 [Siphonobacter sp. BAB-5385]